MFAKNERGYRLNAIKKRFWSLLILLLLFLLIDAIDKSRISSDQKRFFIALSLYPLSFFANTPFKTRTFPRLRRVTQAKFKQIVEGLILWRHFIIKRKNEDENHFTYGHHAKFKYLKELSSCTSSDFFIPLSLKPDVIDQIDISNCELH